MKTEKLIPGLRALLAKQLVEKHGLKRKLAAELLGLSPAAVTQYLRGLRAGELRVALEQPDVMGLVDDMAAKIALRREPMIQAELLELAFEVAEVLQRGPVVGEETKAKLELEGKDRLLRTLRARLQAEQEAAQLFMRVAVRLKNDLSRLLFRQVASDSIRHADIVMTIIAGVEKGVLESADLPSTDELKKLLSFEEVAHVHSLDEVRQLFPHRIPAILLGSVEADEEKHSKMLESLIELSANSA